MRSFFSFCYLDNFFPTDFAAWVSETNELMSPCGVLSFLFNNITIMSAHTMRLTAHLNWAWVNTSGVTRIFFVMTILWYSWHNFFLFVSLSYWKPTLNPCDIYLTRRIATCAYPPTYFPDSATWKNFSFDLANLGNMEALLIYFSEK